MAKRKKKSFHRSRRRSRVAGIGKLDITQMALVVGGAVAANVLANKLSTSTNSTLAKVAPFLGLGAGIALPMFIKSPSVASISLGLVAGGGISALGANGLKVISGFENSIAYPGNMRSLPNMRRVAGIGVPAGSQGLQKGTYSNFSGSRQSQLNTIAGFAGVDLGSGAGDCGCN